VAASGGNEPGVPARVLLIGLMGTGKSTVGRRVAAGRGWPFLDNDELVREATGVERDELLRTRDEAALRAAESAALTAALDAPAPVVAAVAAGVVLDPADRQRLAAGDALVVWLRARPETLVERTGHDDERGPRPWLDGDPLAALTAMAGARARWYGEVADLVIDVDELPPEAAAGSILAHLQAAGGG
jgi:shikimate kinase